MAKFRSLVSSFTVALAWLCAPAQAQLVVGVETAASSLNSAIWHIDVVTGERTLLFNGGATAIAADDVGGRIFAANRSTLSVWSYGAGPQAQILGTVLAPVSGALHIRGMAFGGGRLFATALPGDSQPTTAWLYEIDLTTLAATAVPTTQNLGWAEGLSFEAATGLFYVQNDDSGLFRMDILGGGAPQLVGAVCCGADGGSIGAAGDYYVLHDSGLPIRVYDLNSASYSSASLWCPFTGGGGDDLGADWAPSLQPASGPRVYCSPSPIASGSGVYLRTYYAGVPSASASSGFTLTHTMIPHSSSVIPFYSSSGPASAPFAGGLRCVRAPLTRLPRVLGVSGTHVLDFNAYIASGANPAFVAGQTLWFQLATQTAQGAANNSYVLSAGLRFTITP